MNSTATGCRHPVSEHDTGQVSIWEMDGDPDRRRPRQPQSRAELACHRLTGGRLVARGRGSGSAIVCLDQRPTPYCKRGRFIKVERSAERTASPSPARPG